VAYCTAADVKSRLRRDLTTEETTNATGLIAEADALIDAYLGVTEPLNPIPSRVTVVSSQMVAAVLRQDERGGAVIGATQTGFTAGPFAQQTTVAPGANTGGPWLSAVQKLMLKDYRVTRKAFTIDTAPVPTSETTS